MAKLITGSINVSKIKRELEAGNDISWKNGDDIMVNVSIWVNDQPDQKGNDASMTVGKSKETKVYIGSGLKFFKKREQGDNSGNSQFGDPSPF